MPVRLERRQKVRVLVRFTPRRIAIGILTEDTQYFQTIHVGAIDLTAEDIIVASGLSMACLDPFQDVLSPYGALLRFR
jgi:hypothetical protein